MIKPISYVQKNVNFTSAENFDNSGIGKSKKTDIKTNSEEEISSKSYADKNDARYIQTMYAQLFANNPNSFHYELLAKPTETQMLEAQEIQQRAMVNIGIALDEIENVSDLVQEYDDITYGEKKICVPLGNDLSKNIFFDVDSEGRKTIRKIEVQNFDSTVDIYEYNYNRNNQIGYVVINKDVENDSESDFISKVGEEFCFVLDDCGAHLTNYYLNASTFIIGGVLCADKVLRFLENDKLCAYGLDYKNDKYSVLYNFENANK